MDFNDMNVPADKVFEAANQLRNEGSQPQDGQNKEGGEEQRVPYDRFKEVNDERKKLQEQVDTFIRMQQSAAQPVQPEQQQLSAYQQPYQNPFQPQPNPQQQVAPVVEQAAQTGLFTDEELDSFEQDIVLDPKTTIKKLTDAIMNRGVSAQTKELEKRFEQRFSQLNGQMLQQTLPTVIDNFKRQRFSQDMQAEAQAFDKALEGMNPAMISDPTALENIRLAAIGYVADQRRQNPQAYQQKTSNFFTEAPGGLPGGFGGLGGNSYAPTVPPEVAAFAERMGIDPKDAVNMYSAMNKTGVFR